MVKMYHLELKLKFYEIILLNLLNLVKDIVFVNIRVWLSGKVT
jgi:hypothetical protein